MHVGSDQTYKTIQDALDSSTDNDMIVVHPGMYKENIIVRSAVHLEGLAGAILDGNGQVAIEVIREKVTISGMRITNGSSGVLSTSTGLNLSDNYFYHNVVEARLDIVNTSLKNDFTGYPITVHNNTFDHSRTSNFVMVTFDLASSLSGINIKIGDINLRENKFTNTINRGTGIWVNVRVSDIQNGTIDLGEVNLEENDLTYLGEGLLIQRSVKDIRNTIVNCSGMNVLKNTITDQVYGGIAIANIFTRWSGRSDGLMDISNISMNTVTSRFFHPVHPSGMIINVGGLEDSKDDAQLVVRGFKVTSNTIKASYRGLTIVNVGSGNIGNVSQDLGRLEVTNNSINSPYGMEYVEGFGPLRSNVSVNIGLVNICNNNVSGNGIVITRSNSIERSTGHSILRHGGFVISNNSVSGTNCVYYIDHDSANLGTDKASCVMGPFRVLDNELSGDYGVYVSLDDSYNSGSSNSKTSLGGFEVCRNTMTSSQSSIFFNIDKVGSDLISNSSFDLGPISILNNTIESKKEGVLFQLSSIGCDLSGNSQFSMGDVRVEENTISSGREGIELRWAKNIGQRLNDDSVARIGNISFSWNNITEGDGIMVGTKVFGGISKIGDGLRGNSSFQMGSLEVIGNDIISDLSGIELSIFDGICCQLTANASSKMDGIRFDGNRIISEDHGVHIRTFSNISSSLMQDSRSKIGALTIYNNMIETGSSGVLFGDCRSLGALNLHRSNATFEGLKVSGNAIMTNDSGIEMQGHFEIGNGSSGDSVCSIGTLEFNDNRFQCRSGRALKVGIDIGPHLRGRSSLSLGMVDLSGNRLENGTISLDLSIQDPGDDSTLIIDTIQIDGNMVNVSSGNCLEFGYSIGPNGRSGLTIGTFNITDNDLSGANLSAVQISGSVTKGPNCTFVSKGLQLLKNNLKGSTLGLNLTCYGEVEVYLNNFIENQADVLVKGPNVTWGSTDRVWYRHKTKNYLSYVGNYWDMYNGTDTDDDGIGETPYNTSYGIDHYPFTMNIDQHIPPWNDTTPPSVWISTPSVGVWSNSTTMEVVWDGIDDMFGLLGYWLRMDSGDWIGKGLGSSHRFTNLTEGSHAIIVKAIDLAFNENMTTTIFSIDLTKPSLNILFPQQGEASNSSTIDISWKASDVPSGLAWIDVKLDSSHWSNVGLENGLRITNVADGDHIITVRSHDMAGNQRIVIVQTTVDTVSPLVFIETPSQDAYYNQTDFLVKWTIFDMSEVTSELSLDGGEYIPVGLANEHMLCGLSHGAHDLTFRFTDRASNMVVNKTKFTVDLLPPDAIMLFPGRYIRSPDTVVRMKVNGTGSPFSSLRIRLDGGTWETVGNFDPMESMLEFDMVGIGEGDHHLSFDLTDLAGNHWYQTVLITMDSTSPYVLFASPFGCEVRTDTLVMVELSEQIDTRTFEYEMSIEGTARWNGTVFIYAPLVRLEPGKVYNVMVKGSDPAGNELNFSWGFTTALTGIIRGRVLDERGVPVRGGSIILDTGETAMIGQDGRFSITSPQGNRTVTVTYKGKVLDSFNVDVTAGVEHDAGDRSVTLPIEKDDHESPFPWQLIVLLAVMVALILLLVLYLLLSRKASDDEEEMEWDMEEDEVWGVPPEE